MTKLHLASSSPRRADILRSLGLCFTASGVGIDETRLTSEAAADMVVRLASQKALAADIVKGQVTLGADTAVVIGDEVLGKPLDQHEGADMLRRLSAGAHIVMTGVAVRSAQDLWSALSITEVRFREIGQDEIARYWQSGEPSDKAGGYAIQGLGGAFVESIAGSYSGVVGLPVFETLQLLENAGINVFKTG